MKYINLKNLNPSYEDFTFQISRILGKHKVCFIEIHYVLNNG
jgi:hypothetical protein